MTDEIQDGFNRLKELAENIQANIKANKLSLAHAQLKVLMANLDLLESEVEFNQD